MINKLKTFINKQPRKVFIRELIIAFILLSMPFWFLVYNSVPEVETIETEWFVISSGDFPDLNTYAWVIALKFYPICVLILWYFSTKYWWRYAILVPLIFSIAQFINLFVSDRYFDELEFFPAILFAAPIIILIIWISKKINIYASHDDLIKDIKQEIGFLIDDMVIQEKTKIDSSVEQFNNLKRQKILMSKNEYLSELILFRNNLVSKNL